MSAGISALFGIGVKVRNALYDTGAFRVHRLQRPVVSVGNLSVGGSGKTPFVILLGELLKDRGVRFDVLSRGYGRASAGVASVDCSGSGRDFGDEPLLIARRLAVPVIVGEDRYQAGLLAERQFGSQLHLLDDGFQHRQLARDFDIVLVTPDDARDRLLPAGRLREPLRALARADVVVLSGGAAAENFRLAGKRVWRVRRSIVARNLPAHPVAFCGIARPQSFLRQLRTAGVEPVAEAIFRDHHPYGEKDIGDLLAVKQQAGADGFVTTEKDVINLGSLTAALQPLHVVPVRMDLEHADAAVQQLLSTLAERGKPVT